MSFESRVSDSAVGLDLDLPFRRRELDRVDVGENGSRCVIRMNHIGREARDAIKLKTYQIKSLEK